jgi:hypothetical protein
MMRFLAIAGVLLIGTPSQAALDEVVQETDAA